MLKTLAVAVVALYAYVLVMAHRATRQIFEQNTQLFDTPHVYAKVDASNKPTVPVAGYLEMQSELLSLGFEWVGSLEHMALSQAYPELRTYLDAYVTDAGDVYCASYHLPHLEIDRQIVDFESQLTDGTFLVTTNQPPFLALDTPAEIDKRVVDGQHTAAELLDIHRAALLAATASGKRPRPVTNLDALLKAQAEFSQLECEYRRSVGYLKADELRRITTGLLMLPGTLAYIQWLFRRHVRAHRRASDAA